MNTSSPVLATVLIIDDEPDSLTVLRDALERNRYRVLTARSGVAGLNMARARLPDIVLLDVLLEDMDGFSVCEILRSQPSTARMPVIMMTALATEMARLNGLAAGATDYVVKPIRLRDVIQRIRAVLDLAGRRAAENDGEDQRDAAAGLGSGLSVYAILQRDGPGSSAHSPPSD